MDYVSVKVSSVVSQLNPWDFGGSLDRVAEALRPLLRAAAATAPPTFVNLDMEEYHDLELTVTAFRRQLEEPEFAAVDAGIVLQAYLPDSFDALQELVEWHSRSVTEGRRLGSIKIRLVKGANLAMERVEATVQGWPQAPYATKAETDANYKRCLDWVLTAERTASVRIGAASHNLFDLAWADLLAGLRGVRHRVEFEMLEGMAPAQARRLRADGRGVLLYTPAVAAGNAAILKPAPETPGCAEIVAECCWAAGLPRSLVGFVRTADDRAGRHLVTHPGVHAVILTGAYDTARMFLSWKPDLRLLAETSGKNAMVITPSADIDLAVADLVASAFGHSGQKCSAASLAVCVGQAYDSPRLRRQLADAAASFNVGPSTDLATAMGPTIVEPEGDLLRALTRLDEGEEWLVEPRRLGAQTWMPGVRVGVRPGSWFARTECFGPVLGLVRADSLEEAVAIQNSSRYGLTGGIHTLDPAEIRHWTEAVDVGNAYVNRPITGAVVRRQPFGGWKRSSVGPGAKAGGPNYVARLGAWHPADTGLGDEQWLEAARASDEVAWQEEFGAEHDPTGLFCESNILRYRPLPRIALRAESDADPRDVARVREAARRCCVPLVESHAAEEAGAEFAARLASSDVPRVRLVGTCGPELRAAANAAGVHVADDPVTAEGRVELLHYLREQAVSRTLHRHGNIL